MIWLCLICNKENQITEEDYDDTKKPRYCRSCRNLDALCYASFNRREYLLGQYLKINEKIDELVPSNEVYPKIDITFDFLDQFNLDENSIYSYYNPSKESALRHIKYRIYYNSINCWKKHGRKVCKKKYKKLLKTKFSTVLPIRAVTSIIDFI